MKAYRIAALASVFFLATGCNTFSGSQPVRVSEEGERDGLRWHTNLSSPQALVGAVQMDGSGWMIPAADDNPATEVSIEIRNATPGGVHPWEVRLGQCGSTEETLGARDNYPPLEIGSNGRAASTATLSATIDRSASYSIAVLASPRNRELVVACGNLAPPSG